MKRLVINLNNAEEMKKSYTSPNSIVINIDAESLLAGSGIDEGGIGGDDIDDDKIDDDSDNLG